MFSMRPTLLLAAVAAIFVPPRGLFVSATCYFRDGSVASSYQACPGNSQFCCKLTGTCATNGLCMDPNNYGNGTLANLGNGNYYNQTGLYQTPACVNQDFSGCDTHCTNPTNKGFLYAWGCNNGLTSYCCHVSGTNIFNQMDCCSDGTPRFTLPSATPIPWSLTKTANTVSTSSTLSSTATSTASGVTSTTANTTAASTATGSGFPATEKETSSALSTGAAVGIGIGVAIAVLLVILVALVWRIQRRRKGIPLRPLPHTEYAPAPSYYAAVGSSHETPDDFGGAFGGSKGYASPHVQSQSPPPATDMYQQESKPLVEADGQQMLFEMEGRNRGGDPRELP